MTKRFEYNGEAIEVESLGYAEHLHDFGFSRTIWKTTKLYAVEFEGKTYNVPRNFAHVYGEWYEITRYPSHGYVLGSNLDL